MEKFTGVYGQETLGSLAQDLSGFMAANGFDQISVTAKQQKRARTYPQLKYYFGVMIPKIMKHPKFEGWSAQDVHRWLKVEYMIELDALSDVVLRFWLGEIATTQFVLEVARLYDEATTKEASTIEFEERLSFIRQDLSDRFKIFINKPNEPPLDENIPN